MPGLDIRFGDLKFQLLKAHIFSKFYGFFIRAFPIPRFQYLLISAIPKPALCRIFCFVPLAHTAQFPATSPSTTATTKVSRGLSLFELITSISLSTVYVTSSGYHKIYSVSSVFQFYLFTLQKKFSFPSAFVISSPFVLSSSFCFCPNKFFSGSIKKAQISSFSFQIQYNNGPKYQYCSYIARCRKSLSIYQYTNYGRNHRFHRSNNSRRSVIEPFKSLRI